MPPIQQKPVKYSQAFHKHFDKFKEAPETGFAFFYRQLFSRYYIMALRMVKEDIAATCIAQEAFLRLWQRRESISSLPHLTDFLFKQIKQAAYNYYAQPSTRFYRGLIQLDGIEHAAEYLLPDVSIAYELDNVQSADNETHKEREVQRKQLFALLPDLPENQQHVIHLLLRYSLDYERIAWHLGGISCYVAAKQIEKTIALLKSILVNGTNLSGGRITKKEVVITGGLNDEQARILRYRYELSYSFEEIAKLMDIRQSDVQLSFVQAHKIMRKENAA